MKKMLLLLTILCAALMMTASAEEIYAPSLDEIWTEATLEDFAGHWELSVVSSDQPVDMTSYRHLDIAEDGSCSVNIGSSSMFVGFDAAVSQVENGVICLADENGENGAYYFLFDISLMGCAETLDNPGTILYLTCDRSGEEEAYIWSEEDAAEILSYVEGAVPATGEDLAGVWKCWATVREDGLTVMDAAQTKMTITFDGEQAEITSSIMGRESTMGAQVMPGDEAVLFIPSDEEAYGIFRRGEDELILLDDPELPTYAMLFYRAEIWDQKEAAGEFFTGVVLGEAAQLTSLEQVTGCWVATHYSLGGYVQALNAQERGLEIKEDGTLIYHEEEGEGSAFWSTDIRDNYLLATEGGDQAIYFMLYESGVLVQAAEGDNFGISVYYQRSEEE